MSTDQNPTEHPENLIEGLRQSAAGETEYLGSFEQYADDPISGLSTVEETQVQADKLSNVALATEVYGNIHPIEDGEEDAPVRKDGDVFVPTAEEKASFNNLEFYELARATFQFGEIYLEPVRPGIVATYTDSDYGYLIQETESGFRFIAVEAGETDDFGPFVKTQRAAVQSALADWRKYDDGHGIRWNWIGDITKDASAPVVDAETIARYLSQTVAAEALTPEEIQTISQGLAGHLAG